MIRDARPEDRDALGPLWAECLQLHGMSCDPAAFSGTWALALSGEGIGLRLAHDASGLVGLALHSWQTNSWTGGTDGCLDTLFIRSEARGTGLGRALLDDLLKLGQTHGWQSVFWHVAEGNRTARALYDRYSRPDGYLRHRVTL